MSLISESDAIPSGGACASPDAWTAIFMRFQGRNTPHEKPCSRRALCIVAAVRCRRGVEDKAAVSKSGKT